MAPYEHTSHAVAGTLRALWIEMYLSAKHEIQLKHKLHAPLYNHSIAHVPKVDSVSSGSADVYLLYPP